MNTHGKQKCPLPGCGFVREDYSDNSALGWILHMQFHIFYESTTLPEIVEPRARLHEERVEKQKDVDALSKLVKSSPLLRAIVREDDDDA